MKAVLVSSNGPAPVAVDPVALDVALVAVAVLPLPVTAVAPAPPLPASSPQPATQIQHPAPTKTTAPHLRMCDLRAGAYLGRGQRAPPRAWYPWAVRSAALLSLALSVACSSSPEKPPDASPGPTSGAPSAEDACLGVAASPRARGATEPESVTVSHVLVKHATSKNPKDGVTRTRGEACLRAAEARDKLRAGAPFEEIVAGYSDEPGAATRGGSIGAVKRADVLAPFADAAFELERAQLSDVVETEFGFHVILRTE